MIVVPPLILDFISEVVKFLAELVSFDAGTVEDTARDPRHASNIKTEGLRALTWLELVQKDHFIFGLVSFACHMIELDSVVGAELIQ